MDWLQNRLSMIKLIASGYVIPLVFSLAIHGALAYVLLMEWKPVTPLPQRQVTPKYIKAQLIQLTPQSKRKKPQVKPRKIDLAARKRAQEREKQEQEARRLKAQLRHEKAEKALKKKRAQEKAEKDRLAALKKAKDEKRAAEVQEKQREAEKAQALSVLEEALLAEESALLEDAFEEEARSYMDAISQRIERNWSRPPSARNGMTCELLIQLVPSGEVILVEVTQSSGNGAFDRSAQQAVKKVERFEVVKDMPSEVFERYYRQFKLLFNPQDLRQ